MIFTYTLAKIFGIYLIIIGLMLLLNRKRVQALAMEFLQNEAMLWGLSFFTLILGIVLIVIHNYWFFNWFLIVTILCWIVFLKGLINTLRPDLARHTSIILNKKRVIYSIAVIEILLGIFLLLKGLMII